MENKDCGLYLESVWEAQGLSGKAQGCLWSPVLLISGLSPSTSVKACAEEICLVVDKSRTPVVGKSTLDIGRWVTDDRIVICDKPFLSTDKNRVIKMSSSEQEDRMRPVQDSMTCTVQYRGCVNRQSGWDETQRIFHTSP
ncbi:hypothetical protein QQF64_011622 [Cirrhinus molitorella]|uniref:Uncharacterized protein n=1 Tax=Cirrhinus molitorella TaxID=172907 RepID=A0ABR3M3Y9_9TELE